MITPTRLRSALSVALGAGIAASVALAARAAADAQSFLAVMASYGFTHTDGAAGMLRLGYTVCGMLAGSTGTEVARQVYLSTGLDIDRDDAARIVLTAVEQLCPEYDHRGTPA